MELRSEVRGRGKVLVVDDDPVVLELVKEWLGSAGYEVTLRDQALGTAQWVVNEQPDFILLDVKMPALSGGELTQLLRRNQSTASCAVILHSSMDADALTALASSTGALGALQKTPKRNLFLAGFERLVARHHSSKAK